MTRSILFVLALSLLWACGNRVPANLDQKLDSLRTLEELEKLRAMGVKTHDSNPLHEFYDSLALQVLPIRYSEDFVAQYKTFSYVPRPIAEFLNLEGRGETRAVALPERKNLRLMMVAGIEESQLTEMWLYSLDADFFPVDKLCLYDVADSDEESYFAITSDMDIYRDHVLYHVDNSGIFEEVIVGERPEEE